MLNETINDALECCFKEIYSKKSIPNAKKTNIYSVINTYKDESFIHYLPHTIAWKVTSACNLKCKHCFYYTEKNKLNSKTDFCTEKMLSLAEFFIDELNIIRFTITGGEPFLRKDIFKLLKYLKSRNVIIDLQTNATLITEKIAIKLAKILDVETDNIQISLDGASENTHDKTRGKGSFERTVQGIEHLAKQGFYISISYTVTTLNIDELPELYDLCKKLKVKKVMLGKFAVCSKEQAYLKPDIEKVFSSVAALIKKAQNNKSIYIDLPLLNVFDFLNYEKGEELLDNYLLNTKLTQCQNLMCHNHNRINVNWEGKIHLCTVTETEELCLGNLKTQTFNEIWESRFNNIFFKERLLKNSVCKECNYVNLCHAGCPAAAYFHYGDINAPNGDCPYGKILMKKAQKEKYSKKEKIHASRK